MIRVFIIVSFDEEIWTSSIRYLEIPFRETCGQGIAKKVLFRGDFVGPFSWALRDNEERQHPGSDLGAVIRSVLDDVERIARFEAPRTITAYLDILKLFLREIGRETLVDEIEDVGLYLEMGTSIPTQIALLGIGRSRSTAIRLSEFIADDSLNEDKVRTWLEKGIWRDVSLPALAKREIERVLDESVSR